VAFYNGNAMEAYNFETVVQPDGSIDVRPFHLLPGKRVRISIVPVSGRPAYTSRPSLEGSLLKLEDPFGPASEESEWELD
jgi:hypothetical protein